MGVGAAAALHTLACVHAAMQQKKGRGLDFVMFLMRLFYDVLVLFYYPLRSVRVEFAPSRIL